MEVKITEVSDILTRTVSKHGIIHGLDTFHGRTVKIIILETSEEPSQNEIPPVSEKPYSDIKPESPKQPSRAVFVNEPKPDSEKPHSDNTPTVDRIREYLSD